VARTTPAPGDAGQGRHVVALPAGPTIPDIVGREAELAALEAFVRDDLQGPAAFVLEGQAGIGKSTLWLSGVEYAHSNGLRVYSARPAEAERSLAHVVLGDLFEEALDDVLPALAPPRRRALEVALLRDQTPSDPVDRRALAVAVRDVLQLLSDGKTILIAIDDVQWVDASSSGALAFALRRLAADVRVLLARRLADRGRQSTEPEWVLGQERVQRLPVTPLSAGALHRILHDRLGRPFARQTLLRIHERSDGNPFFALELARALGSDVDPLAPLPVPETLEELLRARIAGLPPSTHEALALVAALGTASDSMLERAGVAPAALEPAVSAHVIAREDRSLGYTHPLLSSVVYRDLGDKRRLVHARIARLVEDPGCRRRRRARRCRSPRRGSWRVCHCGRARRARPPPDSAGGARRSSSAGAGGGSGPSGRR
jgi:hypothetical protein